MKQQTEFIKSYWATGDKVYVVDAVNNDRMEAVVEAESVVDPGWVYVREVGLDGRRGPLHRVQATALLVRHD